MRLGKKSLLLVMGVLCVIGIGTAIAFAESTDKWSPNKTAFTATSTNSVYALGAIEDKCAKFELKGTTPAGSGTEFSEAEAQAGVVVKPTFTTCSLPTAVGTGIWKLALHSVGCKEAVGEDDDCVTLTVPENGATVGPVLGCTLKVASPATAVTVPYNDETGEAVAKEVEVPAKKEGTCPGGTPKFKGTFTVSPKIVDGE